MYILDLTICHNKHNLHIRSIISLLEHSSFFSQHSWDMFKLMKQCSPFNMITINVLLYLNKFIDCNLSYFCTIRLEYSANKSIINISTKQLICCQSRLLDWNCQFNAIYMSIQILCHLYIYIYILTHSFNLI